MTAIVHEALRGRSRWLRARASLVSTLVAVAGCAYAAMTTDFPGGVLGPLLKSIAAVAAVMVPLSALVNRGQLRMMRHLERGIVPLTPDALEEAAREIHGTAGQTFRLSLATWIAGVPLVVLGAKSLAPQLSPAVMGRMVACGLSMAPLGSVLAYLLVAQRARVVLARLPALGLNPLRLAAAPPARGIGLRARLTIAAAILVLTPAALIADLSLALLRRGAEAVIAEPTAELQDLAAGASAQSALIVLAAMGLAVLALVMLVGRMATASISGPLRELADAAKKLEGGRISAGASVPSVDELWDVSVAFATLRRQIASVLGELERAGPKIFGTSEQLLSIIGAHQESTVLRGGALQETSVGTDALADVSRQIARTAAEVASAAGETFGAAKASQAKAEAFLQAMGDLEEDRRRISEAAEDLGSSTAEILRSVNFIASLADRADLLALNAELEASKAADVGRGFSLVAGEMRRLAVDVARASGEIHSLMEEVREATSGARSATAAGLSATQQGASLGRKVLEDLERLLELGKQTAESAAAISSATDEQQSNSSKLAEAMAKLLELTRGGEKANSELQDATSGLAGLSLELQSVVDAFRLGR